MSWGQGSLSVLPTAQAGIRTAGESWGSFEAEPVSHLEHPQRWPDWPVSGPRYWVLDTGLQMEKLRRKQTDQGRARAGHNCSTVVRLI